MIRYFHLGQGIYRHLSEAITGDASPLICLHALEKREMHPESVQNERKPVDYRISRLFSPVLAFLSLLMIGGYSACPPDPPLRFAMVGVIPFQEISLRMRCPGWIKNGCIYGRSTGEGKIPDGYKLKFRKYVPAPPCLGEAMMGELS